MILAGKIYRATKILVLLCMLSMPVFATGQAGQTLVINEVLASSHSLTLDPKYKQFADWIEIYNSGTTAIDLEGSYLTDDFSQPRKWRISDEAIVPAKGYLLFWADGMNDSLHTNFKLSNDGEVVGLYAADGSVIDTLTFGAQESDISYGRRIDNPTILLFYEQPTPRAANATPGLPTSQQSGAVAMNEPSGFYANSIRVTMSAPGTIRYTTDGSTPTRTSREYTTPLAITSTTVLKARAFAANLLPGPIATRTFFIDENVTLPTFSLTIDPDFLWDDDDGIYVDENIAKRKLWERPAVIEFFEMDGRLAFADEAAIRLFGRSAIYYPQKSLSVFLSNRLRYPLFKDIDVREFDSFLLRSSSDDWNRTMFRDGFIQMAIRDHMAIDTQAYRPAVLFINGEYFGIHNIREKYNESYLETHHSTDPDNVDILYIDERQYDPVEVLAGDRDHYDAMVAFCETYDLAVQANYNFIASIVDIDNLIDYVITEAHIGNTSWAHNIRCWRPRGENGKWQWLVFDLDRGFRDGSFNSLAQMADRMHPFSELLDNAGFRDRFIGRFVEYINTAFDPEKVTTLLDSLQSAIAPEMPRHIDRWEGLCGNNACGMTSTQQWEGFVEDMRIIVGSRPATVRQQLRDLFEFNSIVRLDIQIQQLGYGRVQLGEKTMIAGDYSGQFFNHMSVPLQALPNDGFQFVGWQQGSQSRRTLLARGSRWKYFDKGVFPGAGWNRIGFNDATWASGLAELGYGDGDENTAVDFGPDEDDKYVTSYFRTSFQVTNAAAIQSLIFKILRDDGAVVYLNGREVVRTNMPDGTIQYNTWASSSVEDENTFFEFSLAADALVDGENIVAVEVHQHSATSSDLSFDLEVEALSSGGSGGLISQDPHFIPDLSDDCSLVALFTLDAQKELPPQITQDLVLTAAKSPFIASQDVLIRPNVTLSVLPGVEIRFAAGASLIVNGRFIATGTAEQPITLAGLGDGRWGALCFEETTGASTLTHVQITGATTGPDATHFKAAVSMWDSDVTLADVRIENVNQPVYGNGGDILISNSILDGTGAGDDIINIQYASARIEGCHIYGNGEIDFDSVDDGIIRDNRIDIISSNSNRDGIDIGASDNVLIEKNRIFDCPDKGISVGEGSRETIIRGNLVVNASMGVAVKDDSYAAIDRNTFYNDSVGVACFEKVAGQGGGHAIVTNSIFAGAFVAEFSTDGRSSIGVTYSLSERNQMPGVGNLYDDAGFVDVLADNYYLRPDSPCIDAGDPAVRDADESRVDMGAFFYNKGPARTAGLVINEFMADNTKTLADDAGQFDDWIELYNGSDAAIDIAGLYMTDDFSHPARWRIPEYQTEVTTIAPGGYVLLWADEDMSQGLQHIDFKLSAASEQLALVKLVDGQPVYVDSVRFGAQRPDVSRGRRYDGQAIWQDFEYPTPGRANDPLYTRSADHSVLPEKFSVRQNYPNPFNPITSIVYELPQAAQVSVEVFNSLGQRVALLVDEKQEVGVHRIDWRGEDDAGVALSSGVYLYRVTADELSDVHKMVLMR